MAGPPGDKKHAVLIHRELGGLGDILVHRMIFRKVWLQYGLPIHFACPERFHDAVKDHPFIAQVIDSKMVDPYGYHVSFNTTSACAEYEKNCGTAPPLQRSDIWAGACGVFLTDHDMMFPEYKNLCLPENTVLFAPLSAYYRKNFTPDQIVAIIRCLRRRGLEPLVVHDHPIPFLDAEQRIGLPLQELFQLVASAPRVLTVDTSIFHLAGGLKRPMVSVQSLYHGRCIGKYYNFHLFQHQEMYYADPEKIARAVAKLGSTELHIAC